MQIDDEHFFAHLIPGQLSEALAKLHNVLSQNPIASFRLAFGRGTFATFELRTVNPGAEQHSVLKVKPKSGRRRARAFADTRKSAQALGAFRRRTETVSSANNDIHGIDHPSETGNDLDLSSATAGIFTLFAFAGLALVVQKKRKQSLQVREQRHLCTLPCTITLSNRTHSAVFKDISCNGAKIETGHACHPGDTLNIRIANLHLTTRVQWSDAPYIGVNFRKSLPDSFLETLLERAREHSQNPPEHAPAEPVLT